MFTGIVRERGRASMNGAKLSVKTDVRAKIGDSVAIDGVCLTVTGGDRSHLEFDVAEETSARAKRFGNEVNVEPALAVGDQLSGHYVQGHVDAVGEVRSVEPEGDCKRMWIDAPAEVLNYCVEKGSVTVDGVALTITALDEDGFEVALVPHTLEVTTFGEREPGSEVNLEADVLAKYVEKLLGTRISGE
jgi:riboflavin synthase